MTAIVFQPLMEPRAALAIGAIWAVSMVALSVYVVAPRIRVWQRARRIAEVRRLIAAGLLVCALIVAATPLRAQTVTSDPIVSGLICEDTIWCRLGLYCDCVPAS